MPSIILMPFSLKTADYLTSANKGLTTVTVIECAKIRKERNFVLFSEIANGTQQAL